MKNTILVFLLALIVKMDFNSEAVFKDHYKIDNHLISIKENLAINDTLIIYRHRTYQSNCADFEYGYGFAHLFCDSGVYVKEFICVNKCDSLIEKPWEAIERNPELNRLMLKVINSDDKKLKEPKWTMSHDSYHDVAIYIGQNEMYSLHLTEYHLIENCKCNDHAKFIFSLRDSLKKEIPVLPHLSELKYHGKEEPHFRPPSPRTDSCSGVTENIEYTYLRKRFLRRDQTYYWNNGKWELEK